MAYCVQSDLEEQISHEELVALTDDRDQLAASTLSSGVNAAATTIPLADSTAFPAAGRVRIEAEEITYTANAANQLSGASRGANNTTAKAHSSGAAVTELNKIDTSVIARAIADADAEIDGYCIGQYDVPFSPVPVMVRKISVDIAIYHLFARRKGAPEERKNRYNDAIRFLRDVARGLVGLGADAPAQDSDAGPAVTTTKSDRIFSTGRASDGSSGTLDSY